MRSNLPVFLSLTELCPVIYRLGTQLSREVTAERTPTLRLSFSGLGSTERCANKRLQSKANSHFPERLLPIHIVLQRPSGCQWASKTHAWLPYRRSRPSNSRMTCKAAQASVVAAALILLALLRRVLAFSHPHALGPTAEQLFLPNAHSPPASSWTQRPW